ncbi:MAG: isoaspartyl peptidase/L-asparaginase [Planctomycetota bacterium]|jgi:L-asparaginase/beta-aspartyl-peptidase (threonine type)
MKSCIVTHGGVGAKEETRDGPERAAEAGLQALREGLGAMEAAVRASVVLEDDPRFNAGTGSRFCIDGKTIELDATVMDEKGRMGGVAAMQKVKNPILVARAVLDTPHVLLAGEGATAFARWAGFPEYDPATDRTREFIRKGMEKLKEGKVSPYNQPWVEFSKRYPVFEDPGGCDTIGAVASDGKGGYAAANSTGGSALMLVGRVGDSAHFGAGLWAGPAGAVATTGIGEHIIRKLVAKEIYDRMAGGAATREAAEWGLTLMEEEIALGVIAVGEDGHGIAANKSMPAAVMHL